MEKIDKSCVGFVGTGNGLTSHRKHGFSSFCVRVDSNVNRNPVLFNSKRVLPGILQLSMNVQDEEDYFSKPYSSSNSSSNSESPKESEKETEETPETVTTTARVEVPKINDLKTKLLQLSAITNRGQIASQDQRDEIERTLNTLASQNPSKNPVDKEEIEGVWELIYSDSMLFKTNPVFALSSISPFFSIGEIKQKLFVDSGVLENEAELKLFPGITATTVTKAELIPVSGTRIELKIKDTSIQAKSIVSNSQIDLSQLKLNIPVSELYQRINNGTVPETYFDTIYLDSSMRISRSKSGTLFAFVKL